MSGLSGRREQSVTDRIATVSEERNPDLQATLGKARFRPLCGRPPIGKGFLSASATLVGAAMCPACFVRHIEPLATMPSAYQVPTRSSHSRCWVDMGFPDPAVSTGLLH